VGVGCRGVQRCRDSLVRPGGGNRQMAGALFEIDIQFGQAAVEATPFV
jgi:hypothetical protein